MLQTIYRGLTEIGGPAIRLYLARRRAAGKEDPARRLERLGLASCPRPSGRLVWFHAASVGESLSVLILINRLIDRYPDLEETPAQFQERCAQIALRCFWKEQDAPEGPPKPTPRQVADHLLNGTGA